jgi:O-methyltransferase involved in polyketide biosynthesis
VKAGEASETARRVAAHRLTFDRLPAPYGDSAADETLAIDVAGSVNVTESQEWMIAYLAARTAFFDRVVDAGHQPDMPSLFLCEGVAIYLDRAVLESVMHELRRIAAPGSRLAISLTMSTDSAAYSERRTAFRSAVAAMGEPARTVLSPEELVALLATTGWSVTSSQSERAQQAGFLVLEPT